MRKNSIKNTRINGEVQRELSRIISREIKDPRIAPMTSVVDAVVTSDLKQCKAYISVLGNDEEKEETYFMLSVFGAKCRKNGFNILIQLFLEIVGCDVACDKILTECLCRSPVIAALRNGGLNCSVLSLLRKSCNCCVGVKLFGVICKLGICWSERTFLKVDNLIVIVCEPLDRKSVV